MVTRHQIKHWLNSAFLLTAIGLSSTASAMENVRTVTLHYETNLFVEYAQAPEHSKLMLSQMILSGNNFVRQEILTSIDIGPLGNSEELNWSDCYFDSGYEAFNPMETPIISILKFDRPIEPSQPERAWLVNYKERTLQGINTSNVLCLHDIS